MRAVLVLALLAGCAELGVVSDGTSISVGRTNRGYLVAGVRLPDHGEGFTSRQVWIARNNRYGTDEMIDLIIGVARRMHARVHDVRLVVADLSSNGGGGAYRFHARTRAGATPTFSYYMRDKDGQPFEPDAMHVFNRHGVARDGTGIRIDVPRTWLLVRQLVEAPEAPVQYIFMYEPIAELLLDHAKQIGEPADVIARARATLRQPGDSARHDDHMHVRIYYARSPIARTAARDVGPMELLASDQAVKARWLARVTDALVHTGARRGRARRAGRARRRRARAGLPHAGACGPPITTAHTSRSDRSSALALIRTPALRRRGRRRAGRPIRPVPASRGAGTAARPARACRAARERSSGACAASARTPGRARRAPRSTGAPRSRLTTRSSLSATAWRT